MKRTVVCVDAGYLFAQGSTALTGTKPFGRDICLCHACNNHECSNPNHHYWGTPKENHKDQVEAGTYSSFRDRTVAKYGIEEYRKMMKETASKGGKAAHRPYSKEHREKISSSLKNHPVSDHTKEKIRKIHLGRKRSLETSKKISEAMKASHRRRKSFGE